jgi:uncharacterized Zn finger protein (UPF0148 family)
MSETCGKCGSKLVERKTSDSTDYCPVCEPRVVCETRSCQNDPLLESIVAERTKLSINACGDISTTALRRNVVKKMKDLAFYLDKYNCNFDLAVKQAKEIINLILEETK